MLRAWVNKIYTPSKRIDIEPPGKVHFERFQIFLMMIKTWNILMFIIGSKTVLED